MSSTAQGSNEMDKGKGPKTDKSRRVWSNKEEQVLIAALKELVAQGWKSDNGFRAGYLIKLDDAIKKEFPGTDLKLNPNIISKLTAMKKNYYSLQNILSRSGVGFNLKGDHMIGCNDDQWEQIVKMDGNARLMRYKSWPFFEDWKDIFGKDRAIGENAEEIMEAVNELLKKDELGKQTTVDDDYHVSIDDMFTNEAAEDSMCMGPKDDGIRAQPSTRRKVQDGMEVVCDLFRQMQQETTDRLDKMSMRIGYEFDLGKARKEVFEVLDNIPGLSLDEKFDVYEIVAGKVDRLEVFMGLPESARSQYVQRLLNSKGML